jgi:Flp pilus assembly protein TadG
MLRSQSQTSIDRARPGASARRGQTLVEFALVFPLFVTLLMGLIEFGFVFNAMLSVNYAARDSALAAAEAGSMLGADCVILKAVEQAIDSPAVDARIQRVDIFRANPNGTMIGAPTTYLRTGVANPMPCLSVDGSTLPYSLSTNGYTELSRCNILAGCDAADPSDSVDNVSVRITYSHSWVTPLRNFIGGGPGTLDFDRSSVMRMEPVL